MKPTKTTTKKKCTRAAAPAKKTAAKPATAKKAPVKATTKKPAATAPKKPAKTAKTPAKRTGAGIFEGAKEVAITENKIAITRTISKNVNGRYEKQEVREYHYKTPANMSALNRQLANVPAKKVSVKFK